MLKDVILSVPVAGGVVQKLYRALVKRGARSKFHGSGSYWEERYSRGGNSGAGSYNRLADFKNDVLNRFVAENKIHSVAEFGCGDGAQLDRSAYPEYIGYDVSQAAVELCRERFAQDPTKRFELLTPATSVPNVDLALSLDVIYHLVEDNVFDRHMEHLFNAATRFVVIYSSNKNERTIDDHVRHRKFTDWVDQHRPSVKPPRRIANKYPFSPKDPSGSSWADFFVFEVG